MLSTYELKMLAKLDHQHTIEKAEKKRFARSIRKSAVVTTDQCHRFVVREKRPCHC